VKRRAALAATAAFALLGRGANAQATSTLHVIGPPNDGFKAVFYAIRAGIFAKNGVTVETTLVNSGAAAAAALIGGSADIAFTNMTTLVTAHAKAIPMQIIAPGPIFLSSAAKMTSAMLVLTDAPIQTGRDLNGKTIGSVALGDTMSASVLAWIDQNGGDSSTVKIIEAPASAAVQMLQEGRISAAAVNEPAVSQAISTGKARALANPNVAIAKTFLQALFAMMAPPADPQAMRRFAQSMHEASVYTNAHLAETVDIVAGYSGIAPDVVARSARFTDAEYADPALIQPAIDVLAKYNLIPHGFPAQDLISPYALKRPA
jgi:NitT/TauT family transport system substrate-binding protein